MFNFKKTAIAVSKKNSKIYVNNYNRYIGMNAYLSSLFLWYINSSFCITIGLNTYNGTYSSVSSDQAGFFAVEDMTVGLCKSLI